MFTVVDKAIISSDNGSSPVQQVPVIWSNAVLLSIGPSGMDLGGL